MGTPASPKSAIQDASKDMGSDLLGVGAIGLGVGATVLVLKRGWSMFRSFAR